MTDDPTIERGELLIPGGVPGAPDGPGAGAEGEVEPADEDVESISEPAKVMRVGSMIKQLLDEVRATELDEPSRERLRQIYDTSIDELGSALSDNLREELERLAFPLSDDAIPSEAELRIAQAQLVGWLEGLFHGIQATLFAQQMAARQQLERMRGELPQGQAERPGTYL